jgi:hypothetical protein
MQDGPIHVLIGRLGVKLIRSIWQCTMPSELSADRPLPSYHSHGEITSAWHPTWGTQYLQYCSSLPVDTSSKTHSISPHELMRHKLAVLGVVVITCRGGVMTVWVYLAAYQFCAHLASTARSTFRMLVP